MSTITIDRDGVISVLVGGSVESHILASPNASKWQVASDAGDNLLRVTDGFVGDVESWSLFDENAVQWKITVTDDGILQTESFEQNIVLAPIVHAPIVFNGTNAEGYQLFFYSAGTQIPATVYRNSNFLEIQPQPLLLNAFGLPTYPAYIIVGVAYDVYLIPPGGGPSVKQWLHFVGGVPIDSGTATEWSGHHTQASYVTTEHVSVVGDARAIFGTGRRIRILQGTYEYGTSQGTVYDGAMTTITIAMDAVPLNNQVTSIEAGLLTPSGGAIPSRRHAFGRTLFNGSVTIAPADGINLLTAGTIILHLHPPPSSYLRCDGAAVSRTTYAVLFAAIGTTFGVGDGSTTFNLPNIASVGSLNYYIYAQG